MTKESASKNFSLGYFLKFFLVAVFPTHIWASVMIFNDLEFLAERTTMWDAVGYAGYTYIIVLIESVLFALILWSVSFLFPKHWGQQRVLNVIASIFFVLAGASITDMAAHAFTQFRVAKYYLIGLDRYPFLTYALIASAILIGIVFTLVFILSKNREKVVSEVFDRIMLLGYFYLLLDFAGIVIVVLRNVSEKH